MLLTANRFDQEDKGRVLTSKTAITKLNGISATYKIDLLMSKGAKASLVLQLDNKIVARTIDQEDKTEEFSTHCSELYFLSGHQDQIFYI